MPFLLFTMCASYITTVLSVFAFGMKKNYENVWENMLERVYEKNVDVDLADWYRKRNKKITAKTDSWIVGSHVAVSKRQSVFCIWKEWSFIYYFGVMIGKFN